MGLRAAILTEVMFLRGSYDTDKVVLAISFLGYCSKHVFCRRINLQMFRFTTESDIATSLSSGRWRQRLK